MGLFQRNMFQGIFFFLFSRAVIGEALSQNGKACRKDYSRPCAEGWHELRNSSQCIAPLSYGGPCPRFLQIEDSTKQKKIMEQECHIFWPCLFQCEKNYSLQCPEQWVPEDDRICRPLAIYEGTCLLSHDFSNMTNTQKEIWSNKCGTSWPCKPSTQPIFFFFLKGTEWIKDKDGSCSAPTKYSGPCLSRVSLLNVDKDIKVALEKLCNLSFPCIKECEVDMNDPCPSGWFLKSDEFGNPLNCLPPDNYEGLCGEETKFIGLISLEMKEQMAHECGVKWPCVSDVKLVNYEELCPERWTKSEKFCVAPTNYMGPCARKKTFVSFKKEIKKAYAEECNVEWPPFTKETTESFPKISVSRKRKYKFGVVEPFTGDIISGIDK
ncbi:CPW-WPC family protein [Plasmodium gonderi]|uniref:CPW-WPC family protein n=1 Tax=Plasmodium gonderi TaxID=77519 RepID=A0A1Y1JQ25_PLAGO|nr:CPW-WPC family protein [Plasmodium gonderi]GAW82942.1 CPW-WPC family protein [Plasmodium gonderi]